MTSKQTFQDRLFSKIKELIGRPESIDQLRGDVYLLTFKNEKPLIVKAFSSYDKWNRQQIFTRLLKRNGFDQTYRMYREPEPFQLEDMWFGFIEYLPSSNTPFTFSNPTDRMEGAQLLEAFHNCTDNISLPLPLYNQVRKWQDRLALFRHHARSISKQIPESIVNEWIAWGEWSLKGLIANRMYFNQEKNTIIHGDCAHHNFLRKQDGKLALIDFDLIAIGPRLYDYLQYANRILPHLTNPVHDIWKYPQINAYRENPAFLYALAYPSDIFREWNLLFKTRYHFKHVWKISVEDFEKRMNLNHHLAKLVSKN
jgi:hypothetical protein